MMDIRKSFVDDLAKIPLIKLKIDEATQMWGEDVPLTVLFANIGKGIAHHFDLLSVDEKRHVFETIEKGLDCEETVLSTAIATGLLEALFLSASPNPQLWKQIDDQLGINSKTYLVAWRKWQE
jgi:hypothetical protein